MDDAEAAVLDGRYQVLRRLGGPDDAPLVVASDLKRGTVVCLRLWPFSSAMVSPAALPRLTTTPAAGDGPLLPYDFGVDGGVAYIVRAYQPATSLAARLSEGAALRPAEAVTVVRRAAQAIRAADEQGFTHGHIQPDHILLANDGSLRLCGFDHPSNRRLGESVENDVLALTMLLRHILFAGLRLDERTGGPSVRRVVPGARREATPVVPPAVHTLLTCLDGWLGGELPSLEEFIQTLRRVEGRLAGLQPVRSSFFQGWRLAVSLGRRLRHLGPLVQPYIIALGLVSSTTIFLASAFSSPPAEARRLLIYAVAPTSTPAVDSAPLYVQATATDRQLLLLPPPPPTARARPPGERTVTEQPPGATEPTRTEQRVSEPSITPDNSARFAPPQQRPRPATRLVPTPTVSHPLGAPLTEVTPRPTGPTERATGQPTAAESRTAPPTTPGLRATATPSRPAASATADRAYGTVGPQATSTPIARPTATPGTRR